MSVFPVHLYPNFSGVPNVAGKKSMKLEESKADEDGQAVHGAGYFAKITEKKPPAFESVLKVRAGQRSAKGCQSAPCCPTRCRLKSVPY